jgi:glucokinase
MNDLLKSAMLVAAVAAMAWGFEYRGDHQMEAVGALFGQTDPTYALAGWAAGLGVLAFFVGIALLIAGLVRSNSPTSAS